MVSKQMLNNPLAGDHIGQLMMERYAEIVRQETLDSPFAPPAVKPKPSTIMGQKLEDPYRGVTMKADPHPDSTKV